MNKLGYLDGYVMSKEAARGDQIFKLLNRLRNFSKREPAAAVAKLFYVNNKKLLGRSSNSWLRTKQSNDIFKILRNRNLIGFDPPRFVEKAIGRRNHWEVPEAAHWVRSQKLNLKEILNNMAGKTN